MLLFFEEQRIRKMRLSKFCAKYFIDLFCKACLVGVILGQAGGQQYGSLGQNS